MYKQDAPTTMVQPTLCEVIYHGVQDNCLLDDLYTPYRLRGLSGDTGRTSVYGAQSYTDPTTVGRRTPPGFVVSVACKLYGNMCHRMEIFNSGVGGGSGGIYRL